MKTYYLFRHGDTYATSTKTDYGDTILTAPIIPEAKGYIERIGAYLQDVKNPYAVSSEILRCKQTADIVAGITDHPFILDARLNEYYMESFDEYANRISSFVSDMEMSHHENIIMCTHGAGMGTIKSLLLKNEITEDNVLDYPMPGVLWIIKNASLTEISFR